MFDADLQAGLKGTAHHLVMGPTVAEEAQMAVEEGQVQAQREHNQGQKLSHNLPHNSGLLNQQERGQTCQKEKQFTI